MMIGMLFYGFLAGVTCLTACLCLPGRVGTQGLFGEPYLKTAYQAKSRRRITDLVVLFVLFVILTAVAALRIDVGNDYGNYINTFHEIYVGGYVVTEKGFNLLIRLIYTICGGENYLVVFGLFAAATCGLFLLAMYEQSACFPVSFALFMLLGLYFRTFNTVRYYLVLAVTLYSLRYVLKRQYVRFVLWILAASLLHKSVLVVIPLYLLAQLPWKKWMVVLGGLFAVSLPLFKQQWMALLLKLYPSYVDTVYLQKDVGFEGSLAGILRCVLVLALCFLLREQAKDKANRLYMKLSVFALILYCFGSFLPLLSRFIYYLITPQILLIPGLIEGVEEPKKRRILYLIVGIIALLYFGYFLRTAPGEGIRVLPYQTWIFHDREWLNGNLIF